MTDRIETLLDEQRSFTPPPGFQAQAHIRDPGIYERARNDREGYWADWAKQLEWIRPWDRVLEWKAPHAKWFLGGKLNASVNCLDRHVRAGRGERTALIWEGEPGEVRRLTYAELLAQVERFANVLKGLGVARGDRVAIYMPMVPEVAVAMLACARIGAPHTVVFGGFSAESLRDRINDATAKVLVTADGGYRRGSLVPLKHNADEALTDTPSIRHVVVLRRTGQPVAMQAGRDQWWHESDGAGRGPVRPGSDGRGGSTLHPLHLRHDGEAEGHPAHDGRLPDPRLRHDEVGLRSQGLRRVLVHRRRRLGDRPLLRRVRPARARRYGGDVRGRARLAGKGPLLGHRARATA